MTEHLHPAYVEGCYRCDLSRDEMTGCGCGHTQADHATFPTVEGGVAVRCDGWHQAGGRLGMAQRCSCTSYRPRKAEAA